MTWSYAASVEARCARNPSLQSLHNFLSAPQPPSSTPARIVSLDIFTGPNSETHFSRRDVSPSRLGQEFRDDHDEIQLGQEHVGVERQQQRGQILFIENITREIINILGANLAINPMFFAGHLHSAWRQVEIQSPKFCELPSSSKGQSFATFCYHQSLRFPELDNDSRDYKLVPTTSNVPRKVIVFPGEKGRRVGLAQHCCSVLVAEETRKTKGWLGVVLVDPPTTDKYLSLRPHQQTALINTPSEPLFGRTEDFHAATTKDDMTEIAAINGQSACNRNNNNKNKQSVLDDLLESWQHLPDDLDASQPTITLRALSYYPLRLIAAEWVSYLALMCFCLRQYDSPPSPDGGAALGVEPTIISRETTTSRDLDRINSALVSISSWPRRVSSSTISLRKCVSFIKRHDGDNNNTATTTTATSHWASLLDDYEHLTSSLIQQGKQLEAAVPLVTGYLQLAESRRASLETKDVSRLTLLAFVFIPLSFVSSLFSMNPDISPGGPRFWLYFAVALPVVVLALLLSRRTTTWYRVYAWLRGVRPFSSRGCGSNSGQF